ncbi:MAG: endonuclease/exonuclease/phosphatase family protein [Gemmatimonadetes bacterium]|nr:endonuclease/exonuclease/phosphatase family protein [Gemmatimonadota bacterium]
MPRRAGGRLRIATYNFLHGGSARRGGHWSRVVRELAPDLLLAQECRPPEAAPGEEFRPTPADTLVWAPAGSGRWGTAFYGRAVAATPIDIPGFRGWVVGAELPAAASPAGKPLRVFSVHCPAGERGYVRTMGAILDRLAPFGDGADLVVGGDLNVVVGVRGPDEPVRMSRGERELLARLADELGLIPCWQTANPGRPLAQTLRWSANRAAPYHCDGIFIPAAWAPALVACHVVSGPEWDALSDHNPVLAVLDAGILAAPDGPARPDQR